MSKSKDKSEIHEFIVKTEKDRKRWKIERHIGNLDLDRQRVEDVAYEKSRMGSQRAN